MVTRARPAELRSKANRALFDRGRMTLATAVQCEIGDGDPGAIRTRDPQLRRLGGLSKFMSIIQQLQRSCPASKWPECG